MRILQVVHNYPFCAQAGTELYTQDLSLELSIKHEVYVFCRVSDSGREDYQIKKSNYGRIAVYTINNTLRHCNSFKMLYENEEIDRGFDILLDEIKPDLVHIQHLAFLSVGIIDKIKKRGIPILFTLHDYWLICPKWHLFKNNLQPCQGVYKQGFGQECISCLGEMLNIKRNTLRFYMLARGVFPAPMLGVARKVYSLFNRGAGNKTSAIEKLKERNLKIKGLLTYVDLFLAPSRHIKNSFIKFGIPEAKIKSFKFSANNYLFTDMKKSHSHKVRFGFIGTILPAKGLHILIEAFNNISGEDAELRVYGKLRTYAGFEHYLPHLKKKIKNRNIRLMGEFDHDKVADIFREIDVLIVPSLWQENRPLVIEEAFLSQTPLIASGVGGIPELVKDSVNGFLFKPGDAGDLQRRVEYLIKNPSAIKRFRDNIAEFKDTNDAQTIEEIYEGLLFEEIVRV